MSCPACGGWAVVPVEVGTPPAPPLHVDDLCPDCRRRGCACGHGLLAHRGGVPPTRANRFLGSCTQDGCRCPGFNNGRRG
ncbi:MAG TPA: hypothetical protein VFD01_08020 [Candidatus Dormibacteraeota bacterium]|jgi:hypothetical protein|nr:hypothetical protein [Candidatus Dormibacteraeota bacterium]